MSNIICNSVRLLQLEVIVNMCRTPTGNMLQDLVNEMFLSVLSSPNGSDIQERLIAEACGAVHKGSVKLGADAMIGDHELEIKPCKSAKAVSHVNITDDVPNRLIEDLQKPNKKIAIGRCPTGNKFRWVVVCPMSDFSESRYRAMCKYWGHEPEVWPVAIEDQIKCVEPLLLKRGKSEYLRSSQLKFKDIKNIIGFWVHPDIDSLKRCSEDNVIRLCRQMSVPQMAL